VGNDLAKHKRLHGGEPHAFDEPGCAYRAAKTSNLKAHKLTHSGERPYDDPGGAYSATQTSTLKRHKTTHAKK
jgi:hypothetical protein